MVKYSCEQCETKLKKLIVENKKINVNINLWILSVINHL